LIPLAIRRAPALYHLESSSGDGGSVLPCWFAAAKPRAIPPQNKPNHGELREFE
jgi:hypothetical protein